MIAGRCARMAAACACKYLAAKLPGSPARSRGAARPQCRTRLLTALLFLTRGTMLRRSDQILPTSGMQHEDAQMMPVSSREPPPCPKPCPPGVAIAFGMNACNCMTLALSRRRSVATSSAGSASAHNASLRTMASPPPSTTRCNKRRLLPAERRRLQPGCRRRGPQARSRRRPS